MNYYSKRTFLFKCLARIVIVIIAICLIALDYDFMCYAADNDIIINDNGDGTYTITYTYESIINTTNLRVGFPCRLNLQSNDVSTIFGNSSDLTFTVLSARSTSINVVSGSGSVSTNFFDIPDYSVKYTPVGGGASQSDIYDVGQEITISYGGSGIEFGASDPYNSKYSQGFVTASVSSTHVQVTNVWVISVPGKKLSDNEALNEIVDQNNRFREEDRDNATQAGQDSNTLITDMQSLESKWKILWLPIDFTQQLISVFTQGTRSVSYSSRYGYISGYTYNENTGYLEPIRSDIMVIAEDTGGTNITFPSFTLPVLDVKLWDSYTFDLSLIKSSFPIVFDMLYVAISIIELYWFLGFLRNKFDEVFGG